MALKPNAAAQNNPAPAFEDDDAPAATISQVATAKVEATTAVAKAAVNSMPVVAGKFVNVFLVLENQLPPLNHGSVPRLVGAQGSVMVKGNGTPDIDLGSKVTVELYSYNDEFVISPGADTDEAKKLVRYSKDGITIDETGEDVVAYLENLRTTEGYDKAKKKRYVQLVGVLVSSTIDCPVVGDMVQIQISPDGVEPWNGFCMQKSLKIAQGKVSAEGANIITVTAVKKSGNGKNWTTLVVGDK